MQACLGSCCADSVIDTGPGPRANAITDMRYGSKGQTEQQICSWMILFREDTGALMPSCSADTDKLDRARKLDHTVDKPSFGTIAAIPVSGIPNVRIGHSATELPSIQERVSAVPGRFWFYISGVKMTFLTENIQYGIEKRCRIQAGAKAQED